MQAELPTDRHLVLIALPIFARRGCEGASTREIARAAERPMSAITYHFGGKEGLYLACARHIAETIGGLLGAAVELPLLPDTTVGARQQLGTMFALLTNAMVREETGEFARFIMTEQQDPTEAFDIIYAGVMGRVLARMVELLRIVAGSEADTQMLRVRVIALMGQVLAFRIARAGVLRLTGWTTIDTAEVQAIDTIIQAQLTAILDSLEAEHRA